MQAWVKQQELELLTTETGSRVEHSSTQSTAHNTGMREDEFTV